jgi:BirA family biotin operon repressor/biotin-[acetyl-CoA-carboxylase] ligase
LDLSVKIPNPWPGASVFVKERSASTMDDALELALQGYPSGSAVIAGFQEKGRGRAGRSWISAPWESLLVSFIISPRDVAFPPQSLPLRMALSVCRSVDPHLPEPARIKWPNDVAFRGRKLAGVLCESRRGFLLVGIGLNCAQESFPRELGERAVSLKMAGGSTVRALDLCGVVLAQARRVLGDAGWVEEANARLDGVGKTVTRRAHTGEGKVRGIVEGVDGEGALLLLDKGGGRVRILLGEITESL